jgi:hypothetical protein
LDKNQNGFFQNELYQIPGYLRNRQNRRTHKALLVRGVAKIDLLEMIYQFLKRKVVVERKAMVECNTPFLALDNDERSFYTWV